MAIDPQRMAAIMQRLQLAGGNAPPAGPDGGGMMAPQGGQPNGDQGGGVVNSTISGTVMMGPAQGQQGGAPAPVQLQGTVKITKSNVGGPPNMMHIEGDVIIAKPGNQPPSGPQGAPQGMAPQGMPPGGMPPR